MKRVILFLSSIVWMTNLSAQVIFSEDFTNINGNSLPAMWQASNNTDVHNYNRPLADCIADNGLQTPSVGQTAPVRLILPSLTFDAAKGDLTIQFKVFVMDGNLRCATAKNFPCPTYVRALLIKSTYAGGTNTLPGASDIYAEQSYQIRIANGDNAIIFHDPLIPDGGSFRIYFDFKTAENTNCTGAGTKFVFDDFLVSKSTCTDDCPPVANDDYFDGNRQNFLETLKANVFGGFLRWASVVREGYEMQSLSLPPAINSGLDFDVNNHSLASMQFKLVSGPTVLNSQCSSTPPAGTLTWFGDGAFEYTRGSTCVNRVGFQYKIIDSTGLESDTANVTIDFVLNSPLPVNFYSFKASRNQMNVQLKWQTASEKNCRGFHVQRNAGEGWSDRGFVFSNPVDQVTLNSYEFNDPNNIVNATQYRLAEEDINGAVTYSEIVAVPGIGQGNHVVVYPNPTRTGSVTVLLPQAGNYQIALFDGSGRRLREWKSYSDDVLGINNLLPGIYLLKVNDLRRGHEEPIRIIVQNK